MIITNQLKFDVLPSVGMAGKNKRDKLAGKRAKDFRLALGYSSGRRFAHDYGIEYQTWNAIENGASMTTPVFLKIRRKQPGVAHDWFKYGDGRGLSGAALELITGRPIGAGPRRNS